MTNKSVECTNNAINMYITGLSSNRPKTNTNNSIIIVSISMTMFGIDILKLQSYSILVLLFYKPLRLICLYVKIPKIMTKANCTVLIRGELNSNILICSIVPIIGAIKLKLNNIRHIPTNTCCDLGIFATPNYKIIVKNVDASTEGDPLFNDVTISSSLKIQC